MKKIKLLLAAMAAMVGLGANAQSWTASEVGEGYYMLYNVGTSKFLTRGNGWGTQASITEADADGNGIAVQLEAVEGKYKIITKIGDDNNTTNKGLENLSGETIYTDQSHNKKATWVFTQVGTNNGPVYNIVSADNHGGGAGAYLTAGANGTIVTPGNDGTIDGAKWKLMAIPAQPIGMAEATEVSPVDATSLIVNANFSFPAILKTDSWTMVSSNYNACGGDVTNPCAESWRATFTLSQVLTVPNGVYELTAQAAVTEYTATGEDLPVVYANDQTIPFTAMTNGEGSMSAVSTQFTAGNYTVGPIRVVVTTGSLTIGVRGTRTDTWCVWDNFKLTYKGVDLTALRDALQAKIDAVPALEGTTTTAAYTYAKDYADGIDVSSLATEEAISNATNELDNRVNAAKALQTNYARYNTVKAAALAIATSLDTTTPDAEFDAATTNDAIVAAIATLRAAFLAELPNVSIPVDPGYIDVTAVMVDNASVRQNTDYWTIEGTPNGGYSWGKVSYEECEFYNNNFKFYQTLALTSGTWEFGVTGFHRAGNHNTHFYAGEDQILIPGVASSVVNTMAEAKTYFDGGNGKVALKFLIESPQNVEIGINNQDTETDKWTIFRDFTLKYYGAPDYSVYESQWTAAVNAANTAKNDPANANVTGQELTDLNTAIDDAPDGSSKANYLEKINALTTATSAFTVAAPAYNRYVSEKANAERIDASLTYGIISPYTAAEADAAYKDILVAEFNYVAANFNANATEAYGITIDQWTGTATYGNNNPDTPQTNSNQKWGDDATTYYEQGTNGWGSNAWTLNYTKTVTLPASTYVLKVAARASEGVTAVLSATVGGDIYTEDLPNVGGSGLGITTYGFASFDDADEFANSDAGFGWQWHYLAFTLATEGEVTLEIDAHADSQYQWCSFGDVAVVSNVDISALVTAFASFTLPTLGFNDGEYAPYNNVEILEAYYEAKDIVEYTSAPSTQPAVDALTAKLEDPNITWVANVDDVDCVFNGNFSSNEDLGLTGWTRTNGWGQQINDVSGGYGYYNQPGSLKYGDTGVYTMPLDASTIYSLTFKYASWEENSNNGMTVSVLNGEDGGMAAKTLAAYKTKYTNGLTEQTIFFVTAGNYGNYERNHVLTIANNGNTVITDVSIKKDPNQELVFADGSIPNYAPGTYPSVRVSRDMTAGKWVTAIYPFAVSHNIYNNLEIAVLDSYDASTGNIGFSTTNGTSVANKPFLMRTTESKSSFIVAWPTVYEPVAEDVTKNEASLKGVYTTTEIDNTAKNYVLSNNTIYPVGTAGATINPYRAYIQIDQSSDVKALNFFVDGDDDPTRITDLNEANEANEAIYNVAGQRMSKMQKGINIVNGKKVLY